MNVTISPECSTALTELKRGKHKYVIYQVSDDNTHIIVEHTSTNSNWDDFKDKLPVTTPRYAIYSFEYDIGEGTRAKIGFIFWNPDDARIKSRMIYTSELESFKRTLNSDFTTELWLTDVGKLEYEAIIEKVSSTQRLWIS